MAAILSKGGRMKQAEINGLAVHENNAVPQEQLFYKF